MMTKHVSVCINALLDAQTAWHVKVIKKWPEIVGSLHRHVRIERIDNDQVFLGVYDPHWMQELYLLSSTIIEAINLYLQEPRVVQVRFKLVKRDRVVGQEETLEKQVAATGPVCQIPTIRMGTREEHTLALVPDPEIRQALSDFFKARVR